MTPHRHVGAVLRAAPVCATLIAAGPRASSHQQLAARTDAVCELWTCNSAPGCAVGAFNDDSLRKFLPQLPAYADGITVRHLVHQTSALRDDRRLLSIAGRGGDRAYGFTHAALVGNHS